MTMTTTDTPADTATPTLPTIPEDARPDNPLTADNIKGVGVHVEGEKVGYSFSLSLSDNAKSRALNKIIGDSGVARIAPGEPGNDTKTDRWQMFVNGQETGGEPYAQIKQAKAAFATMLNDAIAGPGDPSPAQAARDGGRDTGPSHETAKSLLNTRVGMVSDNIKNVPEASEAPGASAVHILGNQKVIAATKVAAAALTVQNGRIWFSVSDDLPGVGLGIVEGSNLDTARRNLSYLLDVCSAYPLPVEGLDEDVELVVACVEEYLSFKIGAGEMDEEDAEMSRDALSNVRRHCGVREVG